MNREKVLALFRKKLFELQEALFMKSLIDEKRRMYARKNQKENTYLETIYLSLNLCHLLLLSRLLDDDPKTMSIQNIVKVVDKNDGLGIIKGLEDFNEILKLLKIWRGNVLAHDNMQVALATYEFYKFYDPFIFVELIPNIEKFLIRALIACESNTSIQDVSESEVTSNFMEELWHLQKVWRDESGVALR